MPPLELGVSRSHDGRMPYFAAVALILLPALVGWNQFRLDDHELALGSIASEIAERPVEIRCQGIGSALLDATGLRRARAFDHAGARAGAATLDRGVCRSLHRFDDARRARSFACVLDGDRCARDVARVA